MRIATALLAILLVASTANSQEKEKVLAKEWSSPFKGVEWKTQPGVFRFGSCVREMRNEKGEVVDYIAHLGEDFLIEAGTPVLAIADGRVSYNHDVPGTPQRPQWGGIIVVTHWLNDKVPVYSIYGHIERDEKIKIGDAVKRGQKLGRVAKSKTKQNGWHNVDPHLHLQLLVDPLDKYREGECPPGNDWGRDKDGKLVPFPAPYRIKDHVVPSLILNARYPALLLLKAKCKE